MLHESFPPGGRGDRKLLEKAGSLKKQNKKNTLKSYWINILSYSKLANSIFYRHLSQLANSQRLPIAARNNTSPFHKPHIEPRCAAVFNKTLAKPQSGVKRKHLLHREKPPVTFFALLLMRKCSSLAAAELTVSLPVFLLRVSLWFLRTSCNSRFLFSSQLKGCHLVPKC